jgi:hypothetical protein
MNVTFGDDSKHPVKRACATAGEILGLNSANSGKKPSAKNERADINDYDLVSELMQRQQAFRRCDQYIHNSGFDTELQKFWEIIKRREEANQRQFQTSLAKQGHELVLMFPERPAPGQFSSHTAQTKTTT